MKRKKLKQLLGIAIVTILAINTFSSTAYAVLPGKGETIDKLVQSIKENNNIKPNDSSDTLKIDSSIDVTQDEDVNIIVEFTAEPKSITKSNGARAISESKVDRDHEVFKNFLESLPQTFSTSKPKVGYVYKNIFNGQSLTIKASDIPKLLECGVVKKIYKDNEVTVEPPIELDDETVNNAQVEPYMSDSLPHLGIDKLQEEGINGDGVKVGVLDTGIDYNHPDLKNVYKGFKESDGDPKAQDIDSVIGWDFIDNDADPMETDYEDWLASGQDEFDYFGGSYYTSHGTHVSGTIAGTGDNESSEYAVKGVAPKVELYGYRVLGAYGSGATSGIIAAIEKSVLDGMDVINMSLGSSENTPFNPLVTAANNATLAGVVTVIANGNSGPTSQTVGSPATAQLPIAVGASTVDYYLDRYKFIVSKGEEKLDINADSMAKDLNTSIKNIEGESLEVVYCGLGSVEDIKDKDLKGKIALIDRGTLTFVEKIKNATDAGAVLAIIANNVDDNPLPYLGEIVGINTLAVSRVDGEVLKENIENKLTLEFDKQILIEGDTIADFSSVGPVKQTFEIRPDVVAPGYQVLSTIPEYINDKNQEEDNYGVAYGRMSGTSMATPHIAGIAALILQQNPDYTPEDVKAALMNTADIIQKEGGSDYSVQEIGAGRVNPYEAVYGKVKITAEYEAVAGELKETLNNVTGMISYGRLVRDNDNSSVEKTVPVTIENKTNKDKTYNITVDYTNTDRANNAESNNVVLETIKSVVVKANSKEVFDATIKAPSTAKEGSYEGYININEDNGDNSYQLPFSVAILKYGFASVDYPAGFEDKAKGLSAFNSSVLLDRIPNLMFVFTDININVTVNEEVRYIHTFLKNYETGEYIGHAGTEDGTWIPQGETVMIQNIIPNGKVKEIINGEVSTIESIVDEGIYELEVVGEMADGTTFNENLPVCIINDADETTLTTNFEEGIIEVTDDMYTTETWDDGNDYEAIWLKGNMTSYYLNKLKNDYGMDYLSQGELSIFFPTGYSEGNSDTIYMGNIFEDNGDFIVAGIEKGDLDKGFFRTNLSYASPSRVTKKPRNYTFINKGSQYLDLNISDDKITEGKLVNTTLSINNAKDITEGNFKLQNIGDVTLAIKSVKPTKEFQALLDKNNNKVEVSYDEVMESNAENFSIKFNIIGDDIVTIKDNLNLFDIDFEVKNLKGFGEDLILESQYMYTTFEGLDGEFKNSNGDIEKVSVGTIYKNVEIESKERTLVYGNVYIPVRNMEGVKVYAEDPNGNKYEPTYTKFAEWNGMSYNYTFNNLPVIDGKYRIICEAPGSIRSITNVPGGKLNDSGELVGTRIGLISDNFYVGYGSMLYLGDVNNDGAIDILDAYEISKEYHAEIMEGIDPLCTDGMIRDLTQDGAVGRDDMQIVVENYLLKDFEINKNPELYIDGKDLIDILESVGYYNEIPELDVVLSKDKESTLVGEELVLTAIPPTDEVEFDYEFSVRESNDSEWTIIQEKSKESIAKWAATKSGEYEIKVRIFYDDIEYVAQDNLTHTVTNIEPTSIKLDKSNLDINVGEKYKFNVSYSPENAEVEDFEWITSNNDIVSIEDGIITAIKEGEATITVKTKDGKLQDSCIVKVKKAQDNEEPSNPGNPEDPSDPEEPSNPGNPEDPSDPEEPSNPGNSEDPSNPEEPNNPGNSENPNNSEEIIKPNNPEDTNKPNDNKQDEEQITPEDQSNTDLPQTGGINTWPIAVGGLVLLLIGGALVIFKKKEK